MSCPVNILLPIDSASVLSFSCGVKLAVRNYAEVSSTESTSSLNVSPYFNTLEAEQVSQKVRGAETTPNGHTAPPPQLLKSPGCTPSLVHLTR